MTDSRRVTSRELMDDLGLKNVKSLTRWHQLKLIPPPDNAPHPAGAGRIGEWPYWVLLHCRRIRQLQQEGKSLRAIAGMFPESWEVLASRYQHEIEPVQPEKEGPDPAERPLRLKIIAKADLPLLQELRPIIEQRLRETISFARERLVQAATTLVTQEIAHQALEVYRKGGFPVLVLGGAFMRVIPDFFVPHVITSESFAGSPALILPLEPIVASILTARGESPAPRLRPAQRVLVCEGDSEREIAFEIEGNFEFYRDDE